MRSSMDLPLASWVRRYARSLCHGTPVLLDRELHALAGDHDLDPLDLLVHLLLRVDRDPIERVVAPVGVVVVEDEALHLRGDGDVDRARDRGVSPRRLEVALEELSVVDQRVRAGRERNDRIGFSRERVLGVRGVDEGAVVGLDAERERRRRMKDARRAHAEPSDLLVASVLQLADRKLRDRKSTRLNSSHGYISYAVFCLKKKN